jgi:uncharacterized protein
MHVDVSKLLLEEEGERVDYEISGEQPDFEEVKLTTPLQGSITTLRTEDGILVHGRFKTAVELECHRCLRTFTHDLDFSIEAEFSRTPSEDQFPIDTRGNLDLAEVIRQEALLHLPHRQLCAEDCKGLTIEES